MAHRLLASGRGYLPEHTDQLVSAGFDVVYREELTRPELEGLLPDVDAHILGGDERLDAAAFSHAPRLKLVSFVGTGAGPFIDLEAAAAHGVTICTTPGVNIAAVVEHTLGLLLGLVRGLFAGNEGVKRSERERRETNELRTTTVGLLGMGAIAQQLASVLVNSLGTEVIYANRSRRTEVEEKLGLRYVNREELFAGAGAIIIQIATTRETVGTVDERLLGLANQAFLVNTANASIVDPTGLRRTIESGAVQSAAFDGYWVEPPPTPEEDPYGLLTLGDDRFVVTPHTAAMTPETWRRMVDMAVANLIDGFRA